MADTAQRIKPLPTSKDVLQKNPDTRAPKWLVPDNEREYSIAVGRCPVLVSFDGIDCESFSIERFYGCGFGKGGVPWMHCGQPAKITRCSPVYLFTMPGRYKITIDGDDPIDTDAITVDEMDINIEMAGLYLQQMMKPQALCSCCEGSCSCK